MSQNVLISQNYAIKLISQVQHSTRCATAPPTDEARHFKFCAPVDIERVACIRDYSRMGFAHFRITRPPNFVK